MTSRSLTTIIVLVLIGTGAILASKIIGNGLAPENELVASRIVGNTNSPDPTAGMVQLDRLTKGNRVIVGKPADQGKIPAGWAVE